MPFAPGSTGPDRVDESLGRLRRAVGTDPSCHGCRTAACLRGQGRSQRPRQRGDRGCRAVVCGADAEAGHPGRPVGLIADLGDDNLRRTCLRDGRRGACAAVVHDSRDPREQILMVDLADGEAVVPVVDQAQIGPAAADQHAMAVRLRRGTPADRQAAHGRRAGSTPLSPPRRSPASRAAAAERDAATGWDADAVPRAHTGCRAPRRSCAGPRASNRTPPLHRIRRPPTPRCRTASRPGRRRSAAHLQASAASRRAASRAAIPRAESAALRPARRVPRSPVVRRPAPRRRTHEAAPPAP